MGRMKTKKNTESIAKPLAARVCVEVRHIILNIVDKVWKSSKHTTTP